MEEEKDRAYRVVRDNRVLVFATLMLLALCLQFCDSRAHADLGVEHQVLAALREQAAAQKQIAAELRQLNQSARPAQRCKP